MRKILSGLCLLFIIVLTQSTTHADPIVITGGSFTVTGIGGGPGPYTLTGENFSMTSSGGDPGNLIPQLICSPCTPGTVLTAGGTFIGLSLGSGTATINSTVFNVGFGGTFLFSSEQFTVPFSTASTLLIDIPFTFTGLLQGCPATCLTNPPVFSVDLVGSGIATLELQFSGFNSQGVPLFSFNRITYNFNNEIPEPVSLLLLSSGLALLGVKFRRARKPPL